MLTGKQRAFLRGLANEIDPYFQIGKGGVNDNQLKQIDDALERHELVKITVLENSLLDTRSTCDEVAERLHAEPIQSIGRKFVLYKESKKYKTIDVKRGRVIEK